MTELTAKVLDAARTTLAREGRRLAGVEVFGSYRQPLTIAPSEANGGLVPLMAIEMGEEIAREAMLRYPHAHAYQVGFLIAPKMKQLQPGQPEVLTCRYGIGAT
jgi:hypothetical protein